MSMQINKTTMIRSDRIINDDPVEQEALRALADEAARHIEKFPWCLKINALWLAGGFSKVAVFFAEIESKGYDNQLWIVVGDLPVAHLVTDEIPDYKEALLSYVYHMREWTEAVLNSRGIEELIPINAPPTKENALLLASRLDFIEKEYVPFL